MEGKTYRTPDDLPLILRIEDLMEVLDIGKNTAYELVRSGQVQSIRVGSKIRIPKHAVLKFLSLPETGASA